MGSCGRRFSCLMIQPQFIPVLAAFLALPGCVALEPEPQAHVPVGLPTLGFLTDEVVEVLAPDEFHGGLLRSVGDIDGDGLADVAIVPRGDQSRDSLRIMCSQTGAELRQHKPIATRRWPVDIACIGDVDADGCEDYVIASIVLRPGGRLFGTLVESYSGKSGAVLAVRDFHGGIARPRLASAPGTTDEYRNVIALGGSSEHWQDRARPPILILEGESLDTVTEFPIPKSIRFQRGPAALVDWGQDGTLELVVPEIERGTYPMGLTFYSIETGDRVDYLRTRDLLSGGETWGNTGRTYAEIRGACLSASATSLFLVGPGNSSMVCLDLNTKQVRFEGEVHSEIAVVGGLLPVEGRDGEVDLLVWRGGDSYLEPPSRVGLISGKTGRWEALNQRRVPSQSWFADRLKEQPAREGQLFLKPLEGFWE